MDDVFRIIVLRPADLPGDFEVQVLDPGRFVGAQSRYDARRLAAAHLGSQRLVHSTAELSHGAAAVAVHDAVAAGPLPLEQVRRIVEIVTGQGLWAVADDPALHSEIRRVAETLVATRLAADSAGTDSHGLAAAAQGYDVILRAACGQDPVGLRPLAMPVLGEPQPARDTASAVVMGLEAS